MLLEDLVEVGDRLEAGIYRDVLDRDPAVGEEHQRFLDTVIVQEIVEALTGILTEQTREIEGADPDRFRDLGLGNAFVAVRDNVAAGLVHLTRGIPPDDRNALRGEFVFLCLLGRLDQDLLNVDPDAGLVEILFVPGAVPRVEQKRRDAVPEFRFVFIEQADGVQVVVNRADVLALGDAA